MKTSGQRRSTNFEDRRGKTPRGPSVTGRNSAGGMGGSLITSLLFSLLRRGGGKSIILIIGTFLLLSLFSGGLGNLGGGQQPADTRPPYVQEDSGIQLPDSFEDKASTQGNNQRNTQSPGTNYKEIYESDLATDEEAMKDFLLAVLGSTEDCYEGLFESIGEKYEPTTLVVYEDYVQSACGFTPSNVGPFYCPGDSKVYIDMSFFKELSQRYGASGDFAVAYVLAHEVGHHVQNRLGISSQVQQMRQRSSEVESNQLSVRLELQADYLAGVWAAHAGVGDMLEEGDIDEALRAANAIGDDRLQKQARGTVVPDSFTHGTSEQRMKWFMKGFKAGDFSDGDTFNIDYRQLALPMP